MKTQFSSILGVVEKKKSAYFKLSYLACFLSNLQRRHSNNAKFYSLHPINRYFFYLLWKYFCIISKNIKKTLKIFQFLAIYVESSLDKKGLTSYLFHLDAKQKRIKGFLAFWELFPSTANFWLNLLDFHEKVQKKN